MSANYMEFCKEKVAKKLNYLQKISNMIKRKRENSDKAQSPKMIVKPPFWMKSMKLQTPTGRVRMRKVQQKLLKVR